VARLWVIVGPQPGLAGYFVDCEDLTIRAGAVPGRPASMVRGRRGGCSADEVVVTAGMIRVLFRLVGEP
jgi:hypothetical protein